MKAGKIIGILIFVAIIGVGIYLLVMSETDNGDTSGTEQNDKEYGDILLLKGFIGGEKKGFVENEKVKEILQDRYKIKLDWSKAGSIEMVKSDIREDVDFLWPSSQVALELFKLKKNNRLIKSDIVFNSPIVIYSWDKVTEALISIGIVEKRNKSYYIVNFPKLIELVRQSKKWKEIGLELYGKISVFSTDPTKSNSGFMFSGLLANIINGGDVVDMKTIDNVLPAIKEFFQRLGFLEHSSGTLFQKYKEQGMGAYPLVVGYESQIIELSIDPEHENNWKTLKDRVRILYPEPTTWSSHPLIVINKKAKRLIEALNDKELLSIAWKEHGFRSGGGNDVNVFDFSGLSSNITKIINMPRPEVMNKIVNNLSN